MNLLIYQQLEWVFKKKCILHINSCVGKDNSFATYGYNSHYNKQFMK